MLRFLFSRARKSHRHSCLESLEPRQLLSTDYPEHCILLRIDGTPGDDHIVLSFGLTRGDVTIISAPGYQPNTTVHEACNTIIDGGDGDDHIEILPRGLSMQEQVHNNMHASLRGGNGDDVLIGGDDATTFDGGAGNDQILARPQKGSEGMMDLDFSSASGPILVRLDLGTVPNDGFRTHDVISGIGDVIATPFNDIIYTGPRTYTVYGQAGDDTLIVPLGSRAGELIGGPGNDLLDAHDSRGNFNPGPGNDTVIGGNDPDYIDFLYYTDSEGDMLHGNVVRLDKGWVKDGFGGTDIISGIDWVGVNSRFADAIYGTSASERLSAGEGGDSIYGGGGDDTLSASDGSTIIAGNEKTTAADTRKRKIKKHRHRKPKAKHPILLSPVMLRSL